MARFSRPLRIAAIIAIPLALGAAALRNAWGPGLLDTVDQLQTPSAAYAHRKTIAFGAHGQTLDVWMPATKPNAPRPVLIFYYGGGWVKGSVAEYGWVARAFASKGFVVVVPDYRKVPQVRFPGFVQDAADAVKWTEDNVARFGGDPGRIAVAGHSAGGYIAAMLALDPQWLAGAGAKPGVIKAAVGLSGPYDFYPYTGRAVEAFSGWPKPPETQPISYARADAPPMLLVTGTEDTTVRPKNARNLAARLKAVGAPVVEREYPGLGHEDVAMALSLMFRSKAPVLDDSAAFLAARLAQPAAPAQ
jgi:acetyl esterase/lipase